MHSEWVVAKYTIDITLDFEESSKSIINYLLSKLNEPTRSQSNSLSELDVPHRIVKVVYPNPMFDSDNVLQWLNLLVRPALSHGIRLDSVSFSQELCKSLRGPRFGIRGIREILKLEHKSQPLLCFMPEVKTESKPDLLGKVAYEVAVGGINIFIDDEFLHDQDFCRLEARVSSISEGLDRARQETGLCYLYAANISSDYPELLERAEIALENGAGCLMLCDIFSTISEIKSLRTDPTLNAPIYVHGVQQLAGVVSGAVTSVLSRIVGADIISIDECNLAEINVVKCLINPLDYAPHFLPSVPVISGPKNLSLIKNLVAKFNGDVAIFFKNSIEEHNLSNVRKYVNNYINAIRVLNP